MRMAVERSGWESRLACGPKALELHVQVCSRHPGPPGHVRTSLLCGAEVYAREETCWAVFRIYDQDGDGMPGAL